MRSSDMKRIIVNASVARAAGGEGATASISINCTEFLETFQDECSHHVVMTFELSEEWDAHQSNFAAKWLKSMIARKRFVYVKPLQDDSLQEEIETTATQEKDIKAIRKDFHLLHAALATDKAVVSLDETIRTLFAQASQQVGEMQQDIVWVNPGRTAAEQPIEWLKNGALPEAHRQLSAYPTE